MSLVPATSESCTPRRRRAKGIRNQAVPISEFGLAVLAIAEHRRVKPAEWLRGLLGCTPQQANRLIRGTKRAPWLTFAAYMEAKSRKRSFPAG